MDSALDRFRDRLETDEYRQLPRRHRTRSPRSTASTPLTDMWGLTRDEAAEAAAWAVRMLGDSARRNGVAR